MSTNARLDDSAIERFHAIVYDCYREKGRSFPWRKTSDPYSILVSEVMLQQTRTSRVIESYSRFLHRFPDFATLAAASTVDVLAEWQGLGYNRRAQALLHAARLVMTSHDGSLPRERQDLVALPGIGPYTASALRVFAFNEPDICIETNVRTVFIHEFFPGEERVPDRDIAPLVRTTLDSACPRTWFYALMDYGSELKKSVNAARRSTQYRRQSAFEGSTREARSIILRALLANGSTDRSTLIRSLPGWSSRFEDALEALCHDSLVRANGDSFRIAD